MAALKDIARDNADELREGIAWVIVWRTGRSWHALPIWSDLEAGEWEAGDLNDAISVLKVDPDAVALNGYYCGHFGEDMNIEQLAAGIRWHYENGYNRLANRYDIEEAQTSIKEARKAAEAVGLPFSEKLADGAGDEPDPYIYDGSMSPGDYEAAQRARDAHTALTEVVTSRFPAAGPDAIERITDAASGLKLSPETMQRILDAFDTIAEAVKRLAKWAADVIGKLTSFVSRAWDAIATACAPPKWRHYALHAKRARVRKKYRDRIRRAFFLAMASEGGGSS